ncbi:MAG TPA: hypothetical protein VKC61_03630 [Pyrinomonadaceae bacterium]|nr:hypothetical protein [Pyrinomonadaceae bacterium]
MITGFNTDIEHDGVVYHVQTEDKGLESPLILSLVYVGGAILAAKRSRYEDLIESGGFSEEVLTKRLKRQHQLICAAINAGRIEDLKRMGAKALVVSVDEAVVADGGTGPDASPGRDTAPLEERILQGTAPAGADGSSDTLEEARREWPQSEVAQSDSGLTLTILEEEEFRAGETRTIRIELADRAGKRQKPLPNIPLSVKILGTAFRPQIYSVKTERGGVATVTATMPNFTSGRAAVLVRAVVKGETIEVRRVIHPAE